MWRWWQYAGIGLAAWAAATAGPNSAHANWLTSLTKGAGKVATHAHPDLHLGAIGRAASYLHNLPPGSRGLAAHAMPEGHWQFANREGQLFTAGTPSEMARVGAALLPAGAAGEGKLTLYLSEDSVFGNRAHLDKLPKDAELHLAAGQTAYPLTRAADGTLTVQYKANVVLDLAERAAFDETVYFLDRPLNKSDIRTIALEPGSPSRVSYAPKLDAETKAPLVDLLDPDSLPAAFASLRGQTALMVGRIDAGRVAFQPASGGEIVRGLDDLLAAARANDVNLVVLHAATPRQPGGSNWLWQRIAVGGLDEALKRATFGDFLDALGAKRGAMTVRSATGDGRVRMSAVPGDTAGPVEAVQDTFGELFSHVTGEVASKGLEIETRDRAQQTELDGRLIPGIPTYIQIPYLLAIGAGLLGWVVARGWWKRIWPPRPRREEEGRMHHFLANVPNLLVYLLAFLPVAGFPAFLWHLALQLWAAVTAPFRWAHKLLRRRAEV